MERLNLAPKWSPRERWQSASFRAAPPEERDADQVYAGWASRPEALGAEHHQSVEETRRSLQRDMADAALGWRWTWLLWPLEKSGSDAQPLGMIEAHIIGPWIFELGFVIAPSLWGRGYASEATRRLREVLSLCPEQPAFVARCGLDNRASQKVLWRAGLSPRSRELWPDRDIMIWSCAALTRARLTALGGALR